MKKTVLVIIGSASANSANEKLAELFKKETLEDLDTIIFKDLKSLPHFDPELSVSNPPSEIIAFRHQIEKANGIIFCTPEYVFSIPSGLKNALEWCVSTTIFSGKPTGIITASANGLKGHEELQLILQTLTAKLNDRTSLLIQGIKGKINQEGELHDKKTSIQFLGFVKAFKSMLQVLNTSDSV